MKKEKTGDGSLHITVKEGDTWLVASQADVTVQGGKLKRSYGRFGVVALAQSRVSISDVKFDSDTDFPFVLKTDPWLRRLWPKEYDTASFLVGAMHRACVDVRKAVNFALWAYHPSTTFRLAV